MSRGRAAGGDSSPGAALNVVNVVGTPLTTAVLSDASRREMYNVSGFCWMTNCRDYFDVN